LTALDAGILIAVSRLNPVASTSMRDATMWRRGGYGALRTRLPGSPVWQDYRHLAAALLALTAALVIVFR
jgi:hypothetical protein